MPVKRTFVSAGTVRYPVITGKQALDQLPRLLRQCSHGSRLFVLIDSSVEALFRAPIARAIGTSDSKVIWLSIPGGEQAKTIAQWSSAQSVVISHGVSRDDFLLAIGGGAVIDLSGFVAATILRGISWGVVSTTLLAMVDAGIGGKTAVNHPRGKNQIGAIWQPSFVVNDLRFLATLPERELRSGYGELLKYAGLIGDPFLRRMERATVPNASLIHDAAAYKASVVSRDPREAGQRAVLNLGHTIGHALERAIGYGKIRHGEAVIIGLLAALELSVATFAPRTTDQRKELDRYRSLLLRHCEQLPRFRTGVDALLAATAQDKKRTREGIRFVLIPRPGKPILLNVKDKAAIQFAVRAALDGYTAATRRVKR